MISATKLCNMLLSEAKPVFISDESRNFCLAGERGAEDIDREAWVENVNI